MTRWVFRDYVHQNGNNPILKWYAKKLSVREQANMDTLLSALEKKQIWEWPDYKQMQGELSGLGEIRWKGDQQRPLRLVGFKGFAPNHFTILVGCTHAENYDPPNALNTALKRLSDLKRGIGGTREHETEPDSED
jgi:hypothetical protein